VTNWLIPQTAHVVAAPCGFVSLCAFTPLKKLYIPIFIEIRPCVSEPRAGCRNFPSPIDLASGLYNSLYYRRAYVTWKSWSFRVRDTTFGDLCEDTVCACAVKMRTCSKCIINYLRSYMSLRKFIQRHLFLYDVDILATRCRFSPIIVAIFLSVCLVSITSVLLPVYNITSYVNSSHRFPIKTRSFRL